jgi:HemY protein
MTRVVVYLGLIALLASGAVWLAERPGDVAITWLDHRIETSVMVLAVAAVTLAVVAVTLWSMIRGLVNLPETVRSRLQRRRGMRGYAAISQGLVAVGSGNLTAARRFTEQAGRFAPDEPLTLLLRAQAAQLHGDREAAARSFEQMAVREDTRLLGLHGLFVEARRRQEPAAALLYAEQAAEHPSMPGWAGQALLEFRCAAGDWQGALDRLERNMKAGLVDKASYRTQRAVLVTAQALAIQRSEPGRAKALALEAVGLAPNLVPAAALAGRLLSETGEPRKAARIIETAWRYNPHPDLADAYASVQSRESARERLDRMEILAAKSPDNPEAALAVARAALAAKELARVRQVLAPLTASPTKRVAALMAELEHQHGDEGRAREWMQRALSAGRDPAWAADGFVSDRWLPLSPVSGRLGVLEWTAPRADEGAEGAVIDLEQPGSLSVQSPAPSGEGDAARQPEPEAALSRDSRPKQQWITSTPPARAGAYASQAGVAPARRTVGPTGGANAVPVAPTVIPLVHAPDDPGPDVAAPAEPERNPTDDGGADSWTRIRQLFRQ